MIVSAIIDTKKVRAESGLRKRGVCRQVAFVEPRNDQRINIV